MYFTAGKDGTLIQILSSNKAVPMTSLMEVKKEWVQGVIQFNCQIQAFAEPFLLVITFRLIL